MTNKHAIKSQGDYIDGGFVQGQHLKSYISQSPADLNDKVFKWATYAEHIEKACETAHKSHFSWANLPQEERNRFLLKLAEIYQAKEEEIAQLISRETGKPLWESHLEAKALSQKVKITLKSALPLVQDSSWANFPDDIKEKTAYRSKGAILVLGPFNFPAHLPNGHIIPALTTGNTVIFKPSEKTPATAEKMAECFDLAGFPRGVFNLVQGGAKTAQALVQHPLLDGIFFTGSYAVGQKIQQAIFHQPHKILTLEMGGKNSALVWKDADIENAVEEVFKGAFLTCGQRCSATSSVILHKEVKSLFLEKFIAKSQNIQLGHWSKNPFMGPLIDEQAVRRYTKAIESAKKEGALFHLKGQSLNKANFLQGSALEVFPSYKVHKKHKNANQTSLNGYYVSPSIVEPKISTIPPAFKNTQESPVYSFYQTEELFAPFINIYTVSEEKKAIELINQSGYGLCLSVFSKNLTLAQKMFQKAKVGVFHWNLSTNGASSYLPFGGLGKSGNDRPAGLFAVYSTVTPVAYRHKL